MVEYLDGNRIQGSSTKSVPPAKTSWKELDRATGNGGTSIDTGTFTAKDNLMILCHAPKGKALLTFNNSTGNEYAQKRSEEGGSYSTQTSQSGINFERNVDEDLFFIGNLTNISGEEKLAVYNQVSENSAGAGNPPKRQEWVAKYVPSNLATNITSVKITTNSGTFDSSNEIVVLGCDNDEADSGTPYWERLADFTQTTASSSMDTGTFTAKKYLWIQVHEIANANLDMNYLRFNSDSGSNYSFRKANNGASSDTNTSITGVLYATHNGSVDHYAEFFIVNNSDKEKLITGTCTDANSNNQEPRRKEFASKWVNTSSQITSVQTVDTGSGSNPIGVGSRITVWGAN